MSPGRSNDGATGSARSRRRELLAAFLVSSAVVLALFAPFLFGPSGRIVSSPIGDTTHYFVFVRGLYAEELLAGNLPLWNPYIFSGVPFLGAFQTAVLYPPNLLYLVVPLDVAVNLDLGLHVVLLASLTFAWLRGRRMSVAGACLGAAMVALGAPGFLRVLAGQLTVLATFAWVPLLLLAIDRLEERPGLGWTLVGVLATAMILLAGHPPTAYMAAIVCGLYSVMVLARHSPTAGATRIRLLIHLAVVALGGAGLAAAQWITGLVEGAETVRSAGMSWDFAISFSLPPENLLTFLVPEAFGNADEYKRSYFGRWFYWDASAYLGVIGLLMALHGVVAGRSRLRWISLVLAPLLVVLALGEYTPVYGFLYHVLPGFDQMRAPSKLMFFAALFLAALAAEGVTSLQASSHRDRATLAIGAVAMVGLAALAAGVGLEQTPGGGHFIGWLAGLNDEREHTGRMLENWRGFLARSAAISSLLVAVAMGLIAATPRRRRMAVGALVALACIELIAFASLNRGGTRLFAEYLRRPHLAEALADAGTDRVLGTDVNSDLSIRERGFATWGNESVVLLRYAELMAATQGRTVEEMDNILGTPPTNHHRVLGMLRTRFEVDREGRVREHSERLPRFALMASHRVVADGQEALALLLEDGVDWRRTVLLEEEPVAATSPTPARPDTRVVELLDESTDHMTLRVEISQPAILLITDAYARGWRARGLAENAAGRYRLLPADHVMRAIPLDAGVHLLRVEYAPPAWRIGLGISLSTAALYAGVLILWLRRRRAASAVGRGSARSAGAEEGPPPPR